MPQKIGRPKAENPLAVEVKARLDKETADKFMRYCKEHKVKRGETIRELIKQLVEKE